MSQDKPLGQLSNILGVTPVVSSQVLDSRLPSPWQGRHESPAPGQQGKRERGDVCMCGGILDQAGHEEPPAEKIPTATPIPSFSLLALILAVWHHT